MRVDYFHTGNATEERFSLDRIVVEPLPWAGNPGKKLDLLILGDGYTAAERGKFERDARRLVGILLATSPFKDRQRDINVWGLSPSSPQSGISRPSQHIFRRTPLGTTYDAFD